MERRDFLTSSVATAAATVAAVGTMADLDEARAQSAAGGSVGASVANAATGAGAITDVVGVKVGHFTDPRRPTGCTVIITEDGATGGVDVRGSAPGTRETDLLNPQNLVDKVHAIVLSGGSAFGLEAATGAVRYLEERKIGFDVGIAIVPIVPSAILFDLAVGGNPKIRPDAEAGYKACEAASTSAPAEGNVGAGAGATVGKFWTIKRGMKSGIGTASLKVAGMTVGAIVAVNAIGDIIDPTTGKPIAGARTEDGKKLFNTREALLRGELPASLKAGTATTIGVIATDAVLTKAQAQKVAQMAHDGLARTIYPIHTMFDGDTIFTVATGKSGKTANPNLIGILAAEVMAIAVVRAARAAKGIEGLPAAADLA